MSVKPFGPIELRKLSAAGYFGPAQGPFLGTDALRWSKAERKRLRSLKREIERRMWAKWPAERERAA